MFDGKCFYTASTVFPLYPTMVFHPASKEVALVTARLTFGLIFLLTLLLDLPLLFIHGVLCRARFLRTVLAQKEMGDCLD